MATGFDKERADRCTSWIAAGDKGGKSDSHLIHIGSQLIARTPARPAKIPKGARVSDSVVWQAALFIVCCMLGVEWKERKGE